MSYSTGLCSTPTVLSWEPGKKTSSIFRGIAGSSGPNADMGPDTVIDGV